MPTLTARRLPVKPHRRTPRKPAPFGLGLIQTVAAVDEWTSGEARFVLTEYDNPELASAEDGRYLIRCYRGELLCVTRGCDDRRTAELIAETFAEVVAEDVEAERAREHIEACRAFEAFMASEGRLPALCGGAPDRPEATEADRRWWAETSDREMRTYSPKRGRGVNVTDEDVIVATGCCG